MDLSLQREIAGTPDLRHRIRRLGWFRRSFHRCADLMSLRFGVPIDIDDRRLAAAFLDWAEAFESHRRCGVASPRDFAIFAGGLMLEELLRQEPGRPRAGRRIGRQADIVDVWPSGALATSYCLSVLDAVVTQDFAAPLRIGAAASDLRIWQSFRENSREDPSCAIGFLDLFVGNTPNWTQPQLAEARPGFRAAAVPRVAQARLLH